MKYFSIALILFTLATFAHGDTEAPQADAEVPGLEARATEQEVGDGESSEGAPEENSSQDFAQTVFDDQRVFMSCDPCRNACAATFSSCKAACGSNYWCIHQCGCDYYYCVGDCTDCGPQDGPPRGC